MIIFDSRWEDAHGIGRVASEVRKRVFADRVSRMPALPISPVNPLDPLIRGAELLFHPFDCYYSPGFNPPMFGRKRAIFTIHDLIHLRVPDESGALKRAYYEHIIRPAVKASFKVLTVSEYSRRDILHWAAVDDEAVVNVGNGVGESFFSRTARWQPGFPYLLYVGARKPHKNLDRLFQAYALSHAAKSIRLVLSGEPDRALMSLASRLGIVQQLRFVGRIPDAELPAYYQGATALLYPSTFEGFGLPPIEAMAGGTPVLTSNTTSLPEVVGDAALMVDPKSVDAIRDGIDGVAGDESLRARLIAAGPVQARRHSWDAVASKVNGVINALVDSVASGMRQ